MDIGNSVVWILVILPQEVGVIQAPSLTSTQFYSKPNVQPRPTRAILITTPALQ